MQDPNLTAVWRGLSRVCAIQEKRVLVCVVETYQRAQQGPRMPPITAPVMPAGRIHSDPHD
jgi:hypothetical protein